MAGPFTFRTPHVLSRESRVYAIGWSRQGPLKVGYSTNPERRLSSMMGAHPEPGALRVLETWSGGHELELALHQRFADRRLRRGAEWFRISLAELADAIEEILAA